MHLKIKKRYLLSCEIRFCFKNRKLFLVFIYHSASNMAKFGQFYFAINGFFLYKLIYFGGVSKELSLMQFSKFNRVFIRIVPQISKFVLQNFILGPANQGLLLVFRDSYMLL